MWSVTCQIFWHGQYLHPITHSNVHTLNYVDLATRWPIWANQPKGWPDSTVASRHVSEIADDQALIVAFIAHQAHRVAARPSWRDCVCVVDSKVDLIAFSLEQAKGLGLGLGNVGNEATGGVGYLLSVKIYFQDHGRY